MNRKLKVLTDEQLAQYNREGYVVAKGAARPVTLALAQTILYRWVDDLIHGWVAKGLLPDPMRDVDFEHRLAQAWNAAGRPDYIRSPRRDLVSPDMHRFLADPGLLDLAEDLLGTPEILLHGVFNARPKAPDQKWTDTPWHQDAQYFRDAGHLHVVTFWIPLQRVTEQNSCLQVAPGLHHGVLHENYEDKATGFIGLSPEVQRTLKGLSIEMDPGDVLCFTEKTPHRALANRSEAVRCSMDLRYQAAPTAPESSRQQGFVARSRENTAALETYEQWLKKWDNIPSGAY